MKEIQRNAENFHLLAAEMVIVYKNHRVPQDQIEVRSLALQQDLGAQVCGQSPIAFLPINSDVSQKWRS